MYDIYFCVYNLLISNQYIVFFIHNKTSKIIKLDDKYI